MYKTGTFHMHLNVLTLNWPELKRQPHLFKSLQQVAARHGEGDVYVVHYEERLLLALVWETSEVVCDKQQHVDFRFLQKEQIKGQMPVAVPHQIVSKRVRPKKAISTLWLRSIWRFTHSTVIKEFQKRNEESSSMLPVPSDHAEEVGAERRVRFVLPETSDDRPTGGIDGLLQTVRHFHPSDSFHL